VGSRTISEAPPHTLSPASIRNVMADLADEGYLSSPHTSAGRVPTEKAFRFFVGSLATRGVPATESDRMTNEFRALIRWASGWSAPPNILVELTRNVGIAAAIPELGPGARPDPTGPALRPPGADGAGHPRPHVRKPRPSCSMKPTSPEELTSICNYVNRNFSGWQLGTGAPRTASPHRK